MRGACGAKLNTGGTETRISFSVKKRGKEASSHKIIVLI
jgi:hypothetical protein